MSRDISIPSGDAAFFFVRRTYAKHFYQRIHLTTLTYRTEQNGHHPDRTEQNGPHMDAPCEERPCQGTEHCLQLQGKAPPAAGRKLANTCLRASASVGKAQNALPSVVSQILLISRFELETSRLLNGCSIQLSYISESQLGALLALGDNLSNKILNHHMPHSLRPRSLSVCPPQ